MPRHGSLTDVEHSQNFAAAPGDIVDLFRLGSPTGSITYVLVRSSSGELNEQVPIDGCRAMVIFVGSMDCSDGSAVKPGTLWQVNRMALVLANDRDGAPVIGYVFTTRYWIEKVHR